VPVLLCHKKEEERNKASGEHPYKDVQLGDRTNRNRTKKTQLSPKGQSPAWQATARISGEQFTAQKRKLTRVTHSTRTAHIP